MNYYPLILKLDKAGNPLKWIDHEAAINLYAKDLVITALGDESMIFHGGVNAISQIRSTIEVGSILLTTARVNNRKWVEGAVHPLTNRALFRRDGMLCMYCGDSFTERNLTRDHVVPTSRGGSDSWTNVVAACVRCNNHKGNSLLEEIRMKLQAVPFAPNYAEWMVLSNRRIMGDQMQFLKARCPKDSRLWS
ncbi:MAG: HNH endonuclease [Gammaproteobacteria bacterium]|nr:HNH endonuclease [Gammaproteobacteria bacterium]